MALTGPLACKTPQDQFNFTPSGPAGELSVKKHPNLIYKVWSSEEAEGPVRWQTNWSCWPVTEQVQG